MRIITFAALAGLLSLASSTPVAAPAPKLQVLHARQNATNTTTPCASVSSAYFNQVNPSPTVPAKMAMDCIKSVPLNVTSAKALLSEIRPYINWQSTLSFLKNPPAEYVAKIQRAVDILGGLDAIEANVTAGAYRGEYEFGMALYQLIQSAHDGHFTFVPDSVGSIFNFGRTVPLVSVSEDGQKLPAVFAYTDVLSSHFNNISYTPSAVVSIDGEDVNTFLENWSQWGSLQDRDALYNNVFYELAQVSLGGSGTGTGTFTGGGSGRWVYPGPTTTLKFANGTTGTFQNYARVLVNFRGIESGEDLAKNYFYYGAAGQASQANINKQAIAATTTTEAKVAATTGSSPPGYPAVVVEGPQNLVNGYYIDAPGYGDVAVLSVPNFVGYASAEIPFQQTTQNFLPKAIADGKTKLIIDVSANGGGSILQGYDMFKQLFPSILPYGATRFRAHEALDLIGQSTSAFATAYPRSITQPNATISQAQATYFDYQTDANVNYQPFKSWADKFGPVTYNGDNFTSIARWNLSDVLIEYNSGGIDITGYGPRANFTQQPFKAENIVIVYDGYCASTCTIFSELMRQQGGVKAIAMGGRSNRNAIQAVGGVKGTNNYPWGYIQALAQDAILVAAPVQQQRYNSSVLRDYYSDTPFTRAAAPPGANVRDGLRQNDTSGVPLQFRYEEADCRLYYTPEMTVDVTAIWKAAADARWGSGKCVGGQTGGYSSRGEEEVTTSLGKRGNFGGRAALSMKEALERSLTLETEPLMQGDGFMMP